MFRLIVYLQYLTSKPISYPALNSLNYNYSLKIISQCALLCFFLLSLIILNSPILLLLTMAIVSGIPLLTLFPRQWRINSIAMVLLENIINLFSKLGILKALYIVYIFWHQCLTFKGFKVFYTFLYAMLLMHLVVVRYIFYFKISSMSIPFYLLILYFFTFIFLIIRSITEASVFFITIICTKFPLYKEILLSEMPEELPDTRSQPSYNSRPSLPKMGGFLNIHFHKHRHVYPPELPQARYSSYAKIGFAVIGLGFTAIAGYNYHRTADATVRAADATVRAADATVRAADISAVQAGLMTSDEFYKRHPKDSI